MNTRVLTDTDDLQDFVRGHPEIELAVWDFDGVIVNSEPMHAESYRSILTRLGHEPPPNFFSALAGHTEPEIWRMLATAFPLEAPPAELHRERVGAVLPRLVAIAPAWYVRPLLESLRARDVPSHLISSGNNSVIAAYLDAHGLRRCFDAISIATPADVGADKPQLITQAMEAVTTALLIEDSQRYLDLGYELGAVTIAVRHEVNTSRVLRADGLLQVTRA